MLLLVKISISGTINCQFQINLIIKLIKIKNLFQKYFKKTVLKQDLRFKNNDLKKKEKKKEFELEKL
jgi:hypothetical protein